MSRKLLVVVATLPRAALGTGFPTMTASRARLHPAVGALMMKRNLVMSDTRREADPVEALTGSMRDFREPHGADLMRRIEPFYEWQNLRRENGLWPYSKSTEQAPRAVCAAKD